MNQERVRVVGVLTALVNGLQRREPLDEQTGQDASSSVLLVDALVHCSNVNSEGLGVCLYRGMGDGWVGG